MRIHADPDPKLCQKVPFFTADIFRLLSGGYNDDLGTFKKLFKTFFFDKILANGLQFQNITLDLVQDAFKCIETAPEVPSAIILPPGVHK